MREREGTTFAPLTITGGTKDCGTFEDVEISTQSLKLDRVRWFPPVHHAVPLMSWFDSRSNRFVLFSAVLVVLCGEVFSGLCLDSALGHELERKITPLSHSEEVITTQSVQLHGHRVYQRYQPHKSWNQRVRTAPGQSGAALRFRAYRQKMALRTQRSTANAQSTPAPIFAGPPKRSLDGAPAGSRMNVEPGSPSSISTSWVSVGPAPLASDATGDGEQDYNWVSGRATSVLIDPADPSGNTVLLGAAYGGLWKSSNAGSLSSTPAAVMWQPLIDDQPTLAVGAIALQPLNSSLILVGTGETNSSADSYYGLGILRSVDGGSTWTHIRSAASGQSFLGIGFSKIAFSTANPNLVVAATAGDNGLCLGLETTPGDDSPCLGPEEDGSATARGLYFSQDSGVSWNRVILADAAVPASGTAVIYNANQGPNGTFYASIRRHGLYSSTDGLHFARLTAQPSAGLASSLCPPTSNASSCLIYRGEFAVVPGRNEMYAWVVDVQPDINGVPAPVDAGIWQSTNGGTSWTQVPDKGITSCGDDAFGPNSGCGVEQGWYNLALAAIPNPPPPNSTGTDVYAGAVNLYKCTLEPGSTTCTQGDWINLTHVYGCSPLAAPAHVHPNQHGIAFTAVSASDTSPGYFAHDGGISRTLDGYSGLSTGSCSGANQFDSLSQTLGSMTELVSVSTHPTNADILLSGARNNGAPKTSTATTSSAFQNAWGGDGGFTAINPTNPSEWFAANPYVNILKCEVGTDCNDNGFVEVVSSESLGGDQGAYDTPYILDPQNSSELLVGTCRVWRISASGTAPVELSNDFETLGTGLCTGNEINLVNALSAGDPVVSGFSSVVYAVTNGDGPFIGAPGGEVWATTNAGVALMTNVTQNANPNGYAISSVTIDSSDTTGQTAYVGIMGFSTPAFPTSHVWKTANAGSSWTDWTGTGATELPDAPVNALLGDAAAGLIYAGTDVGVFVSATGAPSWTEVGPAPGPEVPGFLPNAPVTALQLFNSGGSKTLVASTDGRGIGDYSLAASPGYTNVISNSPQTIFPTQTATFNGTLSAAFGYNSPVNLSCAGASPPTCMLNPQQEIPTAHYTLTAGGNVVAGNYIFNAQAVGTDPLATTVNATITLRVVDFDLTAPSPNSLTVEQGDTSGTSIFQVTATGSFGGTVALSCPSGLPAGAACAFSPSNLVSPTSLAPVTVTLTVDAAAGAAVGGPVTVTIAAIASGAPSAKTQTFSLTVTKAIPDFAIAVTAAPNTTLANQNVTWNGTLTSIHGYGGSVALTCTAGAPGTCALLPPTLTPTAAGAAFTVTLGSAIAGAFTFTIQGTDGTLTRTTSPEILTVGTDVTWTDTGSAKVTVLAGQSATYSFSAASLGGSDFTSAVSFGCANLPALTLCKFNPATIATGSGTTAVALTITTSGPNLGTQSRQNYPKGRFRILPFFTLAWVVTMGISLGRKRGGKPRLYGGVAAICLGLGLLAEMSCGGVTGSSGGPPPPPVTVTISPKTGTVLFADEAGNSWAPGATQKQFSATVNGSTNQA